MKNVQMLLEEKGTKVWSVAPDDFVIDALRLMADKNIGAVLVQKDGEVVGIFSERDYARKGDLQGHPSSVTKIGVIMTDQVICISPDTPLEDCMGLMTERRIRHLPVLDGEILVGIISIGDVVKEVIQEQEFIIEQLEDYITLPR